MFYFGELGADFDQCERACRAEPQCASYVLFSTKSSLTDYRGQCYGRSLRDDIEIYQDDVTSGVVAPCTEGRASHFTLSFFIQTEQTGVLFKI